jgi:hypothetical protein
MEVDIACEILSLLLHSHKNEFDQLEVINIDDLLDSNIIAKEILSNWLYNTAIQEIQVANARSHYLKNVNNILDMLGSLHTLPDITCNTVTTIYAKEDTIDSTISVSKDVSTESAIITTSDKYEKDVTYHDWQMKINNLKLTLETEYEQKIESCNNTWQQKFNDLVCTYDNELAIRESSLNVERERILDYEKEMECLRDELKGLKTELESLKSLQSDNIAETR